MFPNFLIWEKANKQICDYLLKLKIDWMNTNKKIKYANIPVSLDIESSSFFRSTGSDEKIAIMYEWTFNINSYVVIGRTWEELIELYNMIVDIFKTDINNHIIIYIHNLSYEFQFFCKHFEWYKVFAIDSRKPLYAITIDGIEFRCSYLLSGYSLSNLAGKLQNHNIKKLSGDLDYKLIRHSETVLTENELMYCIYDSEIVVDYIAEQISEYKDISKIPLTKTGKVRTYCRNQCLYDGSHKKNGDKYNKYHALMKSLTISESEYTELKYAFQGGFTHANAFKSGKCISDVTSYDFTSSYPAVMIAEKYPMSRPEHIHISSKSEFMKSIKNYCCIFEIYFENITSKILQENYISASKCRILTTPTINNGRIVSAERILTTVTEQDFIIISQCYEWENIKIGDMIRYKKDYLPTDFIKSILNLYEMKTTLKGVSGKEVDYLKSKEMINSCYGMCVTDIVRNEQNFIDMWISAPADAEKSLKRYNQSKQRFLYYPWGIWVTAYARRNLFTGIITCGNDYIYSDTDSIKITNQYKYTSYIDKYNRNILNALYAACENHNIDINKISPKTINGNIKTLGVWDFDGHYKYFKTLGAKRYLTVSDDDVLSITISGINKSKAIPYLFEKYETIDNIISHFDDDLYIPAEYTGKNIHTYIDDPKIGYVKDYTGKIGKYEELSSIHLSESDYSLSISREYADYITGIKTYTK